MLALMGTSTEMNLNKILIIFLISLTTGCAESYFLLSDESRLPLWFEIPESEERNKYSVSLTYYVWPSGREAVLKLEKKDSWLPGEKVVAKQRGLNPIVLKSSPDGRRPSYEVVTADGITDIIEHRAMEPIFYISEDPKVWSELGVKQP
jgi:hypothetical protein